MAGNIGCHDCVTFHECCHLDLFILKLFRPQISQSILHRWDLGLTALCSFSGTGVMLGHVLLLVMLENYIPAAHPSVPIIGKFTIYITRGFIMELWGLLNFPFTAKYY